VEKLIIKCDYLAGWHNTFWGIMRPNPLAGDVMPALVRLPQICGGDPEQFGIVQIALTSRGHGSLTGGTRCDRTIALDRALHRAADRTGRLCASAKFTLSKGAARE